MLDVYQCSDRHFENVMVECSILTLLSLLSTQPTWISSTYFNLRSFILFKIYLTITLIFQPTFPFFIYFGLGDRVLDGGAL